MKIRINGWIISVPILKAPQYLRKKQKAKLLIKKKAPVAAGAINLKPDKS